MKKGRILHFPVYFVLILLCSVAGLHHGTAAAETCQSDASPPVIVIKSPTQAGTFTTSNSAIKLTGDADDDVGIISIVWTNNRGGSGTAISTTDWVGPWYWEIDGIALAGGDNLITVTAVDVACRQSSDTLLVTYTAPPPPPPPQTTKSIDLRQAKFTFYFGNGSSAYDRYYNGIDRFSTVGYLLKLASETFVVPFSMDVTVTAEAPDPRPGHSGQMLQLFRQTIPAGTVSGTTKYRYTNGGSGINELTLYATSSTMIYMYLFVDKTNFVLDIKSTMTPADYLQFVRSINSYTLKIQMGATEWKGTAPLVPGTYGDHKQELVYNR